MRPVSAQVKRPGGHELATNMALFRAGYRRMDSMQEASANPWVVRMIAPEGEEKAD